MRISTRLALAVLVPLGLVSCLDSTTPSVGPVVVLDCSKLATSLDTSTTLVSATSPAGLRYRDDVVGTGTTVATGQRLSVHYAGCLTTGAVFDYNFENLQNTLDFTVGSTNLIPGFSQGVIGMKVGGQRSLVIPPSLGYGANANGPIPANSTLVFTVVAVSAQ